MKSQGQNYFEAYTDLLSSYSDNELISTFNKEVGNSGWGTARASFLAVIHAEFIQRGFDYSAIGDEKCLTFKNHITMENNTIKFIKD